MSSDNIRYRVVSAIASELISAGLADVIADSAHFKLVASLGSVDDALTRLALDRPNLLIVDAAAVTDLNNLRATLGSDVTLVAIVHSYVPLNELRRYDAVLDVAQSRGELIRTLIDAAHAATDDDGSGNNTENNYELSKRETDVLVLVAKGLTNKEIADDLNLSVHTVISHRKNIMHKTGIKSVAGLTMYAMLNKLL